MLPGASKPVVAVRFCPVPFNLRGLASGISHVLLIYIKCAVAQQEVIIKLGIFIDLRRWALQASLSPDFCSCNFKFIIYL